MNVVSPQQNCLGKMVLMGGHHIICFLFLDENVCCEPSTELSWKDGSGSNGGS